MKTFTLKQWKFHYNDCPDAWFKGYDAEKWKDVTVPHDWSVHMPFSKDNSSGTGYLPGGIGWYRTSFNLPEEYRGKRISIIFDGVYKNSQVWCNSYYLGKRPNGYSTFRYDITDQVCFGTSSNIIAVKVDHRDIADSRWFTGSGINRKVTIIIEEAVHAEAWGIFFKTPEVSESQATIEVTSTVANDSLYDVTVTLENQLIYNGNKVLSLLGTCEIPAGKSSSITNHGTLYSPILWSVDNPALYELKTIIRSKSLDLTQEYLEEIRQQVGVRSIHFDPNTGFYLNGKSMKLKGVCVHDDAGCLGTAVLPDVWLRRLSYLKEMGCNAIRMSHNPHMQELYDLCDALGFLVIDEAFDEWEGAKNKWWTGHNVYPPKHQGYYEAFPQWHERDLSDLIKQNRNHPSIIMWSIGNEIDYPNDPYCHPLFTSMTGNNDNNKPAAERMYNPDKPNAERLTVLCNKLVNIVKEYDMTRPVTAAVAFPELSTQIGYIDPLDVVGYNYKEEHYDKDHQRFPDKPFLGSENSRSFQAWKIVRDTDYISGQFLWTGIDYLGEAAGWPVHGSGAGLMTLAGFPKASYYFRKSLWDSTPFVYLVTARADYDDQGKLDKSRHREWKPMYRSWNYIPGEAIEVRCYTNQASATLYCNGLSYGESSYDDELGYLSWFIPFEAGELKVISDINSDTANALADTIQSTGSACAIDLKIWEPDTALNSLSDGQLKQIEVTITDMNGNWVANDSSMLFVEVSGPVRLLGLENGDLADNTEYSANYRRAYEGRLLIYAEILDDREPTKVTVRGRGLKKATIEL